MNRTNEIGEFERRRQTRKGKVLKQHIEVPP